MSSRTTTPGEPVEAEGAQQATTAATGDRDEPGGRYSPVVGWSAPEAGATLSARFERAETRVEGERLTGDYRDKICGMLHATSVVVQTDRTDGSECGGGGRRSETRDLDVRDRQGLLKREARCRCQQACARVPSSSPTALTCPIGSSGESHVAPKYIPSCATRHARSRPRATQGRAWDSVFWRPRVVSCWAYERVAATGRTRALASPPTTILP